MTSNHVWSYDFVSARTRDGRMLRLLVLIDEYTREGLAIRVARRLGSYEVIETLGDVMVGRGIPEHIQSDNGPEFVVATVRIAPRAADVFLWSGPLLSGAVSKGQESEMRVPQGKRQRHLRDGAFL
jgi:hypothetical protein